MFALPCCNRLGRISSKLLNERRVQFDLPQRSLKSNNNFSGQKPFKHDSTDQAHTSKNFGDLCETLSRREHQLQYHESDKSVNYVFKGVPKFDKTSQANNASITGGKGVDVGTINLESFQISKRENTFLCPVPKKELEKVKRILLRWNRQGFTYSPEQIIPQWRDLNIRSDRQEKKHEPDAVSAAESEQEGDMEVLSMLATKRLLRTMKAHAHVSSFCEKHGYYKYVDWLSRSEANLRRLPPNKVKDIEIFNIFLFAYARKNDSKALIGLFDFMISSQSKVKPNHQTVAAFLICAAHDANNVDVDLANKAVSIAKKNDLKLSRITCYFPYAAEDEEKILRALRAACEVDVPQEKISYHHAQYRCKLVNEFNTPGLPDKILDSNAYTGILDVENLHKLVDEQIDLELRGDFTVKNVTYKPEEIIESLKQKERSFEKLQSEWLRCLRDAFHRKKKDMLSTVHRQNFGNQQQLPLDVLPFLCVLPETVFVDIMFKEVLRLCDLSQGYSESLQYMYTTMGLRVMRRFHTRAKVEQGLHEKAKEIYLKYGNYFSDPTVIHHANHRQHWMKFATELFNCPDIGVFLPHWPDTIVRALGSLLYGIILQEVKVFASIRRERQNSTFVPAFYTVIRQNGFEKSEQLKPHECLVAIMEKIARKSLTFDVTVAPMVVPPVPRLDMKSGGLLVQPTDLIRLSESHSSLVHSHVLKTANYQIFPVLDSMNQLSSVGWKINESVLNVMLKIFCATGDSSLDLPPSVSYLPQVPRVPRNFREIPASKRKEIFHQRHEIRKQRSENYSLWCTTLYKLSIADHFRDRTIWFPVNLDFRGRCYPIPPYFNHMGDDLSRGMMLFAKGERLGKNGLDWLKIHCVNLTGLKKRNSLKERLIYANSILDQIIDSAEKPLTGKQWWRNCDEPWQVLAVCMEIAKALKAPNPEEYICHFPVHQDGSCNGLQHYAALGRDKVGAEQVNLSPSERPQDVYLGVANLVEQKRQADAKNGKEIAQMLEGYVTRKVVKQTVMTTVYGVTFFGARLQIAKQLKELQFPSSSLHQASVYLANLTFHSLGQIFESTRKIQNWLTEIASLLGDEMGRCVEWITPLGLPVVQPYVTLATPDNSKSSTNRKWGRSNDLKKFKPDVLRQRNGFPPNFIHSLDSTHMMLTSLHCHREGITFTSVHDCYWTHPCSVEIMNKKCREQFVALHSEPLLENLSDYLLKKCVFGTHEAPAYLKRFARKDKEKEDNRIADKKKIYLIDRLKQVPKKGEFQIDSVIDSTYFFS